LRVLVEEVEGLFRTQTSAEWISALRAGGVPCGRFNFPPEALRDPQLLENDFVVEMEHPLLGPYKTFGPVVRMDATPVRIRSSAPLLDEHTDEVLREAGLGEAEIAALRGCGAAGVRSF
jgi:crotonobetainyl-CoA:carnitine CoA-transferase CaiB-like acyl-CoA transferase